MPEADFTSWSRETLEQFARQAADQNRELRADLRAALDAYRALVREAAGAPVMAGSGAVVTTRHSGREKLEALLAGRPRPVMTAADFGAPSFDQDLPPR